MANAVLAVVYAQPLLGATAAVLTVGDADHPVTVMDLTGGAQVLDAVQTVDPRAAVRASELAERGLTSGQLDDATLTLHGTAWRITSVQPKPGPQGEGDGEYLLFLEAT